MTILQQRPDELIAILRPEFMSSPGLPGGDGGWLNKIYHIPSSTDPLGVYEKTDTGLDQASAAASSGDVIYSPAAVFTANHSFKDGVEYWGAGRDTTILTGEIGIGTAIINNMSITRTANDADILRAIVGPLSGIGKLYNCNISVAQAGAGEAGDIDIVGAGSVYAYGCNFTSSSVGGDSYVGIRALGETGEIKLWDCQIDAGTKGFKEYEFTGAGWVWEAPGISISVVKPAFGIGDGYSAWSAVYNPPADAQAFVYRHQRTGGVSNEWSHTDYSPDGGSTDHTINDDQNPVDKILYFRKLGYDPGVDAQVLAKYPAAIWKGNANTAVLGPNQVVRAGWSSGFGIDVTYTVTAYMLDVLRFSAAGSYNWTDAASGFYVYSVQGPYDGIIDSMEPMTGEAGAWNTENYPTRHGRDIYANFVAVDQYHNDPNDPFAKGSAGHVIEDEGTPLTQRSALNFVGAGVTVTDDAGNDASVVTIPIGGGPEISIDNVSNPPTEAQLITAFGPPDDFANDKKIGILDDNALDTNYYAVFSDMGHYLVLPLAKSALASLGVVVSSTTTIASPSAGEWFGRPAFTELDDGTWALVYREGTGHGTTDGVLHIRFSSNKGGAWTAEDTDLNGNAVSGWPAYPTGAAPADPYETPGAALIVAPDGHLLLVAMKSEYTTPTLKGAWLRESTDGGITWGSWSQLSISGAADNDLITFSNDYFIKDGVIYASGMSSDDAVIFRSTNNGHTWDQFSTIALSAEAILEPSIEWIGGNRLIASLRDDNNTVAYQTESTDFGSNWSALTEIQGSTETFGKPILMTRAHMKGYDGYEKDSVLIMHGFQLMTPGSSHPRRNAIWISQDRGSTWNGPYYLDTQTEDGGYGDMLYDSTNNQFVFISYYGTLLEASVKQYKVTITGI